MMEAPLQQRPREASMAANGQGPRCPQHQERCSFSQVPPHSPRYNTRADDEAMPEWQLDCLLKQYAGDGAHNRAFAFGAFGAFVWPSPS